MQSILKCVRADRQVRAAGWVQATGWGRALVRAIGLRLGLAVAMLVGGRRLALHAMLAAAALAGVGPGLAHAQCVWVQTPNDLTAELCVGDTLTLTAIAILPGNYTWRRNGVVVGTGQTLTLTNVQESATGTYVCIFQATGAFSCSIQTSGKSVVVRRPPVFTSQPAGGFFCEGQSVTLSVAHSPNPTIRYMWLKNNQAIPNSPRISGVEGPTLSITGLTPADEGNYTCDLITFCDSVTSTAANVQVGALARVTGHPASTTACAGGSASFTVTASGAGLRYAWQYLLGGQWTTLTDGNGVSGSSTATLTLSPVAASQSGWAVRCQVTGTCSTATTNSALLTVNRPVTGNLVGPGVWCRESTLELRAQVQGDATAFRWFRNGQRLNDSAGVSGSTTAVLRLTPPGVGQATYMVEVDAACGPMFSASLPVLVVSTPVVPPPSGPSVICVGQPAVLSISASGGGLTYRWIRNGVELPIVDPEGRISGADGPTLTISNFQSADEGDYAVRVSNACTAVLSSSVSVRLTDYRISQDLRPLTLGTPGGVVTLPVRVTPPPPSGSAFQWQRNGQPLINSARVFISTQGEQSLLNIAGLNAEDFQSEFRCVITTPCGQVITSTATRLVPIGATEVEPNDGEGAANLVTLPAGTALTGTSTGTSGTTGLGSLDMFRLSLPTLPGIRRYTLTNLTESGHRLSLRGQMQNSGVIGGAFTNLGLASPSPLVWYTLGTTAPEVYVRVTGTTSTTQAYALRAESEAVLPLTLSGGPLVPGAVTFSTTGTTGPTQVDTDLWLYDSNLNAIPGAGNDEAPLVPGSLLTRTLAPGEYTLAISRYNLAGPLPSPADDRFRNGDVSPNAGTLVATTSAPAPSISVRITDAAGERLVPMPVEQAYGVAFLRFTVGAAACSIADVVAVGGAAPGDGLLTGDDFIAFINAFSTGETLADVVAIGGTPPGDGLITGDDFNAFIAAFAQGCP